MRLIEIYMYLLLCRLLDFIWCPSDDSFHHRIALQLCCHIHTYFFGEMSCFYMQEFQVMVRDLYASYPVLIRYVDLYRSGWIKEPHADAEILFDHVAHVFNFWSASNVSIYPLFIRSYG